MLRVSFAACVAALSLVPSGGAATVTTNHICCNPDGSLIRVSVTYAAGPGEANDLTISPSDAGFIVFRDPGAVIIASGECTATGPHEARCPPTSFVSVDLADADDRAIVVGSPTTAPCVGDVRCLGRISLADGPGRDVLQGGPGGESFIAADGAAEADQFHGAEGLDEMSYASRARRTFVSLDGRANDGERGEGDNVGADVENVRAGRGGMTFIGNAAANRFFSVALDTAPVRDIVFGGGGDDMLDGVGGDDLLRGGRGNDTLRGFDGRDRLAGGPGRDTLTAGAGADILVGGSGRDSLAGFNGPDLYCTRDGARDRIKDWGRGRYVDRAYVDRLDRVADIEVVLKRPCPP